MVVGGELVITGCDAPPILEPAPEALDKVAGAVGFTVVRDGRLAAASGGDDDFGAVVGDGGTDGVAVIAAVGDETVEAARRRLDQGGRHGHVAGVAGRDQEHAWSPGGVGQPVELAGPPAARGADGLREGPPFAPAAERWTLMLVESIATEPQAPLWPVSASNTANQTPWRLQR